MPKGPTPCFFLEEAHPLFCCPGSLLFFFLFLILVSLSSSFSRPYPFTLPRSTLSPSLCSSSYFLWEHTQPSIQTHTHTHVHGCTKSPSQRRKEQNQPSIHRHGSVHLFTDPTPLQVPVIKMVRVSPLTTTKISAPPPPSFSTTPFCPICF